MGNQLRCLYAYYKYKLIKEKEKAENRKPEPGRKKETGYNRVNVKVNDVKNVKAIQDAIKKWDMGI